MKPFQKRPVDDDGEYRLLMATELPFQSDATACGEDIALRSPAKGVCYTHDAFWRLCQLNPELNFERNEDGSIVVMTPAGGGSARRSGQVYGQLFVWAMKEGTGEPFDASAGFTLPNGAVRSPDASWVLSTRWNALSESEQEAFPRIAPDFVAEVRSKSDSLVELRRKMQEYIEQGVRLGWLIDPESRLVEIYRPQKSPQHVSNAGQISGDPELPGFVLDLAAVWGRKSHE